jgi:CHAT domain-containing protein
MPVRDALVEIAEESTGGLAARLLRCRVDNVSIDYPNARKFFHLQLDPATLPPLNTSANVEQYGSMIRAALATHPAIGAELAQIFQAPHRTMLQFWIVPPQGECFRWETLCEAPPLGFLALHNLCTVTRLADINGDGSDVRAFRGSLRMAAFLSPIKMPAKDEFAGLMHEIKVARNAGLNIQCTVYLGEQDLLDQAKTDIADGNLPGVTAEPMPFQTNDLERELRKNPVELLHFFCHGLSGAGVQALELATISDNEVEREAGSVLISIERLNEILDTTRATWVTVLNACSGAKPAPGLQSMALTLAKRGSPIAVGMAEPISGVDATIFSKAFYEELFHILCARLIGAAPNSSVSLDLTPAVINARRMVFNQYQVDPPDAYGRWTLPLLYERFDPLIVQVSPPGVVDDAMRIRINTVAGALKSLPDGTPDQMRDDLLTLLDKNPKVPMSLRPNRFGVVRP